MANAAYHSSFFFHSRMRWKFSYMPCWVSGLSYHSSLLQGGWAFTMKGFSSNQSVWFTWVSISRALALPFFNKLLAKRYSLAPVACYISTYKTAQGLKQIDTKTGLDLSNSFKIYFCLHIVNDIFQLADLWLFSRIRTWDLRNWDWVISVMGYVL